MSETSPAPGVSNGPAHEEETRGSVDLSVLIPVSERPDDLREIHAEYTRALSSCGLSYELIYVLDGPMPEAQRQLGEIRDEQVPVTVMHLNRWFGEATALAVGFDRCRGEAVLTLPCYFQVDPAALPTLMRRFREGRSDVIIAWRHPRIDSRFNRLQSWLFRRITQFLTGTRLHDLSCGLRIMRRKVAEEVQLYGDLHRFFPLLAYQRGFKVEELQMRQSARDVGPRVYRPGVYLRRLLDILTLFFLFKFTKKPLRFFGLLGSGLFGAGFLVTAYLGVYRLLGLGPLANRPLLILGVLLIVLGVQLFSIGLLGEIIIFTHAGRMKDYEIEDIRGD